MEPHYNVIMVKAKQTPGFRADRVEGYRKAPHPPKSTTRLQDSAALVSDTCAPLRAQLLLITNLGPEPENADQDVAPRSRKAGRPAENIVKQRNDYHQFLLGVRAEMARRELNAKGQPTGEEFVPAPGISIEGALSAFTKLLQTGTINDAEVAIILLQFVNQAHISAPYIKSITRLLQNDPNAIQKLTASLPLVAANAADLPPPARTVPDLIRSTRDGVNATSNRGSRRRT